MPRSAKKQVYYELHLLLKSLDPEKRDRPIRTKSRNSSIIPEMVGRTFEVYNGKKYIPQLITEDMIGHKLGEFSPTRVYPKHPVKTILKKGVKK